MNKIKEDKPIGVIIHLYMEISQGNFLCSYLFSNKLKYQVFIYLFSFFFYKIREQVGGAGPAQGGGMAPVGGGR
jgi:hypothetical protein